MAALSTTDLAGITGGGPRECAVTTWALEDAQQARRAVAPAKPVLGSEKLGNLMYGLRSERALAHEELAQGNAASACDQSSVRWRLNP